MSVNAQYSSESFIKLIAPLASQSVVECRFSADGISEILAVGTQVACTGCEVTSGRLNYSGRLVCTIVYAEGQKLCRAQKGAEFSHFADDGRLAPAQTARCMLSCERATVRRDGSSFVISAVIGADCEVYGAAERTMVTSAEGAVLRRERLNFATAVTFSGSCEVEDSFEVAGVGDILMHSAKAVITDCRCGGGGIEASGEIFLSMLAVRGEEPVALDRTIPFTAEILCDEAIDRCNADCLAQVSEALVSAKVDEERGRCQINFAANLALHGCFMQVKEEETITDGFIKGGGEQLSFAEENVPAFGDVRVYSERVSGACAVKSPIDYTCAFRATACASAECTYSPDTCMLEGAVTAVLIYTQGGELKSTGITLPFSLKLNGLSGTARIEAAVSGVSVRQRTEGECEAEATVRIVASSKSCEKEQYLCDISQGEGATVSEHAIQVLVPSAGQSLWDTAKKLRRTPEEVAEACGGVQFPLRGNERIVIYTPKGV